MKPILWGQACGTDGAETVPLRIYYCQVVVTPNGDLKAAKLQPDEYFGVWAASMLHAESTVAGYHEDLFREWAPAALATAQADTPKWPSGIYKWHNFKLFPKPKKRRPKK